MGEKLSLLFNLLDIDRPSDKRLFRGFTEVGLPWQTTRHGGYDGILLGEKYFQCSGTGKDVVGN